MKQLLEYELEDGSLVLVEVDEPESGGLVPAANPGELAARAQQTLSQSMNTVRPFADAIIQKLRGLSDRPDEMEVQFGLKLSAEAGAVLASCGAEANYTVTLRWKAEEKGKEQTGS